MSMTRPPQESSLQEKSLPFPHQEKKLLLHCCCSVCSCAIMEVVLQSKIETAIFFYNPNIHPLSEYERRKDDMMRLASRHSVPWIDADYEPAVWFEAVRGDEHLPEGGRRCATCMRMRLCKTAEVAVTHRFPVIATTLGMSRWKNLEQVTAAGRYAAAQHHGVTYWDCNWRKQGRTQRMAEIAREEGLYRQSYCGCVYSQTTHDPQPQPHVL